MKERGIGLIIWWTKKQHWLEVDRKFWAGVPNNTIFQLTYVAPAGNIVNFEFSMGGVLIDVYEGRRESD